MNEDIQRLYQALIHPYDRSIYERVRSELIWEYGYDEFRELQCEAFKLICRR